MEDELITRVKQSKLPRSMKSIMIQTINVIIIKYKETHVSEKDIEKLIEQQEERTRELLKKYDEYRQLRKEYESLNDKR